MPDGIPDPTQVSRTPPIRTAPPRVAAPKNRAAPDPVIPLPIPDAASPGIPDSRFVSVPRREIDASIDPQTGRPVFHINVNGRQVEVPPNGWLV